MNDVTPFDPIRYWEERHVKFAGDHRNVGNMKLSSTENFGMLVSKSVRLGNALGRHGYGPGARVLDAGCGAGVITEFMRLGGFDMSGFDASPTAIAEARRASPANYAVAGLSDYSTPEPFDVVMCNDVLFHVVVEEEWRRAVGNLVNAVKPGGLLVIVEAFGDFGKKTPSHVVWRQQSAYETVFREAGLQLLEVSRYVYIPEGNEKTLLVARRG